MKACESINPTRMVDIQKRNRKDSNIINKANYQSTKMKKEEQKIFKTNRGKSI